MLWDFNQNRMFLLTTSWPFPIQTFTKNKFCLEEYNSQIFFKVGNISFNFLREGNGTPLQYSCLENLTKRLHFHFHALEKEMATHSSTLVWRIPGTGEPGGLPSMGSHRVGHDWSDLAEAAAAAAAWSIFLLQLKTSKSSILH